MRRFKKSFERLIRRAQTRDQHAFLRLIDRYRPEMLAIAKRAIGPKLARRIDAEDIVQSVILNAWTSLGGLKETTDTAWKAWLAAILKTEILLIIRHHIGTQFRSLTREAPPPGLSGSGGGDFRHVAPDTSPSGRASRNEELEQLEASLKQLSPDEEAVVRLQRLEGMTIGEIAVSLDRSPGSVGGLLARGVQHLTSLMQRRTPRRIDDEPSP